MAGVLVGLLVGLLAGCRKSCGFRHGLRLRVTGWDCEAATDARYQSLGCWCCSVGGGCEPAERTWENGAAAAVSHWQLGGQAAASGWYCVL